MAKFTPPSHSIYSSGDISPEALTITKQFQGLVRQNVLMSVTSVLAGIRYKVIRATHFWGRQIFTLCTLIQSPNVTLKLPHTKLSVFYIYRPPTSVNRRVPFSKFLDEFSSFLSLAASTLQEFIITGDFNIHLDNPTNTLTFQFLSMLSSSI